MGYCKLNVAEVRKYCEDIYKNHGFTEDEARGITDVVLCADLYGIESHGVQRMIRYHNSIVGGHVDPKARMEIVFETPVSAVIEANRTMGQVTARKAMQMAIDKAKEHGFGMVTVRNCNHYGIAGYWTSMASKEGMIGLTGTNARPSIAPTFGVENMLGTNPLTFSLPTDEEFPFCLDCATSIVQRGRIEYYAREGRPTPAGTVVSENGEALTDSEQILKDLVAGTAALAPLGGIGEDLAGYKGYGYATVVEILSAALAGGQFMKALSGVDSEGKPSMYHLGHFFFVIDPDAFIGREEFKKIAGDICRELRASKKAPGQSRIYTAGEKEYEVWLDRKDKGVPVGEGVQKDIIAVRDALGLDYKFDFE